MSILSKARRHGWVPALCDTGLKALNRVTTLRILRGVYVERADPAFLTFPSRYQAGFLSEEQLRRYAADPESQISQAFLDEALARGDQCFALREGETLAAYGWYAMRPTPIGIEDLALRFGPNWVYMYKGYTHPRYRGERLHAIGMSLALEHYVSSGLRGLVSYVEATNYDSLKSCFRMNYRIFGSVLIARLLGRVHTWRTAGCAHFDFDVAPRTAAEEGAPLIPRPRSRLAG